jgi:polysaccharide deacetylase family protein (PEP-CTERM system associated)
MKSIFTVDVEDWFHILDLPSTPPIDEWDSLPSRVVKNFSRLLDLFSEKNVQVTCFFLAWVAEKYPEIVKEASGRGHEIASHGYSHTLVYNMSAESFFQDALRSKEILEDITGQPVLGYRSAGFSNTENTPWFFDKLIEAGYSYDSSVFPAPRGHGGMRTGSFAPHLIESSAGKIMEFPITVSLILGKPVCLFGGGYLRLFPYWLIRSKGHSVLHEGRPVIFYIHPREIDPEHPRLPMNFRRKFKSYFNLRSTEVKIKRILNEFKVTNFREFIKTSSEQRRRYD